MSDALKPILAKLRDGELPNPQLLDEAFTAILSGQASHSQIGAYLMGLEAVGIDADMIHAGATALRRNMLPVIAAGELVDVCGTGGDGAHTLNISTAVSFVLAGAGYKVAKHGNRAMSSKSGAGDVLEALGVNLAAKPETVAEAIETIGVGFMFAQAHHPAMVHVAPVRRDLGFRTIFNMLGPLSNPAAAQRQLIGVYDAEKLMPMAKALDLLGSKSAWLVHGDGGLDEVSLSGPTKVVSLKSGVMHRFEITPEDAGVPRAPLATLRGGDATHNAAALTQLLDGKTGAYRDSVCLNTAAALMAFGSVSTLKDGVEIAASALDSGSAKRALDGLVALTQRANA